MDNKDNFPDMNPADDGDPADSVGYWPWDVPDYVANMLSGNSTTPYMCYCPAQLYMTYKNLWTYGGSGPGQTTTADSYRVFGDQFAWKNTGGFAGAQVTNITGSLHPSAYHDSITEEMVNPPLSARVIIDDYMGSNLPFRPIRDENDFRDVVAGTGPIPTSHLNGTLADGNNLLFADSHVAWRPFSDTTNCARRALRV